MARGSSAVLSTCIVAVVLCGSVQLFGSSFVPPQRAPPSRRDAMAGLTAAMLAGVGAAPEPANAIKFSIFGFGDAPSDAYAQLDKDSVTPYNPFPNPENADYVVGSKAPYIKKKKEAIDKMLAVIYKKVPESIAAKDFSNLNSAWTLQGGYLRQAMEYVSCGDVNSKCDQESPQYKKVREVFQDISDVKARAYIKDFVGAKESYDLVLKGLAEWKEIVKY